MVEVELKNKTKARRTILMVIFLVSSYERSYGYIEFESDKEKFDMIFFLFVIK